jgi:integrase
MRDRVLIGLLLECGLRREEAAALTVAQVQQRDGRMVLTDLRSKGERIRTVPVPEAAAIAITEWLETLAAQGEPDGALLRQVNKADRIERGSISASAIYKRIGGYAEKLKLDIAPHDLRRSFGKLTKAGGAETEQIMTTLGHASIVTTEIYLGIRQDLSKAPCDFISLEHNSKGKK